MVSTNDISVDTSVAPVVQGLFAEIPESAFRADISSTELREQGQALK